VSFVGKNKKNLISFAQNYCMITERVNCLIIGSGPAGYTAAIYASRANLNPVLYEGLQPGGQLTTTTDVENFPGYPDGVSGFCMMEDMKNQALRFGADIRQGEITEVDFSSRPFVLKASDGKELHASTVIIATGATAKYLGLPSEQKFKGQGVSACATCDGFFYRKKDVAVVGGGDTACEEAVYLAGLCNKVYLIVRRHVLRASQVMQNRVLNTENIEILWEHQTKEILGDESGVTGALLINNGKETTIAIHGFFLAIGHHPNSDIFKKYVETDEMGYILTKGKTTATNIPGVFAAGDVQDSRYRQGITAAASGCMAAKDAELCELRVESFCSVAKIP
jgi:thioredoxin reductase (NADPH)